MLAGVLLCTGLVCAGCSSTSKSKKKEDAPAVLVPFANHIELQRAWSTNLSGEAPKLRLGLGVCADGERVFAASHKGVLEAFDVESGKVLWRRNLKAPLAGGPAAGHGLVVVGSSKGEVIALSQSDGQPRWRIRINAEILSPAAIDENLVVVRGVDGRMHGLSASDGSELWLAEQQVPRLSLRGTGPPSAMELAVLGPLWHQHRYSSSSSTASAGASAFLTTFLGARDTVAGFFAATGLRRAGARFGVSFSTF